MKLFVFNKLSQMDVGMNVYVVLYYRCTLMGSAQASSDSSTAAVAAAAAAVAAAAAAKTAGPVRCVCVFSSYSCEIILENIRAFRG